MELLDRYLQAVRFWLPRAEQQDIIDELSAELHAQIADREAELGHPLDSATLEALLKQSGHPLRVAGRYLPQQQLIGQPWFSLYFFAVKAVLLILMPLLAVILVPVALTGAHPVTELFGAFGDVIGSGIYMIGLLTVLFAILEKLQVRVRFLDEDWEPRKLPKLVTVADPVQIPRSASFGAFVGILAFSLWWMGLLQFPETSSLHVIQALPTPFYWPVLLLLWAEMFMHVVNLIMPWWTRWRAAARLLIDLGGLALSAVLLMAWPWFNLVLPGIAAGEAAKMEQVVNLSLLIVVCGWTLGYLLRAMQDLRRALGRPPLQNWAVRMFTH